jgi:hypothetical protein
MDHNWVVHAEKGIPQIIPMVVIETVLAAFGILICVWTITLSRLPVAQRPRFSWSLWSRVGVPLLGGALTTVGSILALRQNPWEGGLGLAAALLLAWLLLRHDQPSAMIRILFEDYLNLKRENPQVAELDLLYSLVKCRRPHWTEDRILEVCVGKDIKQLVLLLLIIEFDIHPLNDMRLYERLKQQVERLYPAS